MKKSKISSIQDIEKYVKEIFPSIENLLKKYANAAKKERKTEKPPFVSILSPIIDEYTIHTSNLNIEYFENARCVKPLVCVHYPPAKPAYYLHLGTDLKNAVWRGELRGWEAYGKYEHGEEEELEYYMLHPKAIKKKIKVKDVCNDRKFSEEDIEDIVESIKSINKNILDIKGIEHVITEIKITVLNELYCDTLGSFIEQEKSFFYINTDTTANKIPFSYSIGAFGGPKTFHLLEKKLFDECIHTAEKNVKFSEAKRSCKKLKLPGKYNVVLDGRVAAVALHECVGHMAEADRILIPRQVPVFYGKIGKKVASNNLTLIDNSMLEMDGIKPMSFYKIDDEGVEKELVKIINNGVFNSFLHSKLTAGTIPKEKGGGKLTGNARVEINTEWVENEKETKVPCSRISTLFLEPRDYRLEELLEEGKDGLYISSGNPTGNLNAESGNVRVNVDEIYFITKSAELIPLYVPKNFTVFLSLDTEFIKRIKEIGDRSTVSMDSGYCTAESGFIPESAFAPAILVENVELKMANIERPLKKPLIE